MDQYHKSPHSDSHPVFQPYPLRSMKPDRTTLPRLLRNLKFFFLDSWVDLLLILVIAGIAGIVSLMSDPIVPVALIADLQQVWVIKARPARLFPLYSADGIVYAPEISYPYQKNTFSSLAAGLICGFIPLGVIIVAQIWLRSFADFSSGVLGLLYALAAGTCFQVILKKAIGGLRPHLLAVCQPVIPSGVVGVGFNQIMYNVDQVCTGDQAKIINALQSFPSGHSEIAFAGLGYLAIYLFTHLRIPGASDIKQRLGFWRMILVLMPIVLATYIACTLVLGYHHHASDCFFGAAIGLITAMLGYVLVYHSLFDGNMNWRPRLGKRSKREMEEHRESEADDEEAANPQPV